MDTISQFLADDRVRTLAVLFGVFVALISIGTARSLARKKQAADLIFAVRTDSKMQEATECLKLHSNSDNMNIKSLANSRKNTEEAALIRYLANHFETLSVGIQNGIYDETMLKETWYNIVRNTYKHVRPYIEEVRLRDQKPTYYQEFEQLAVRWEANPLQTKKKWRQGFKWLVW